MPVSYSVTNEADHAILVYRLRGAVRVEDVLAATGKALNELTPRTPYSSLMLFAPDADLSELKTSSLSKVLANLQTDYRRRGLGPRKAAAVVHSPDTKIIVLLWNAVCDSEGQIDFTFAPFDELDAALDWLGLAHAEAQAAIAKAE